MVERTEPIRKDIEATRASMTDKMEQIEGQVREKVDSTVSQARQALDLRHQVNERPWVAIGAALAFGFVVGSLGGNDTEAPSAQPGQPMRYYTQPDQRATEDRQSNSRPQTSDTHSNTGSNNEMSGAIAQITGPIREELSMMGIAAVRSAMRALRESLQESIPQFESEYRAMQSEHDDDEPHSEPEERSVAVGEPHATYQSNKASVRAPQGR